MKENLFFIQLQATTQHFAHRTVNGFGLHSRPAIELVKAGATELFAKTLDGTKSFWILSAIAVKQAKQQAVSSTMIYHKPQMQRLNVKSSTGGRPQTSMWLITGGEMVVVRSSCDYIHQHSKRAARPLSLRLHWALPTRLMEAELFGAEKGAFYRALTVAHWRFEAADKGTPISLDEIGN